MSTSLTRSEQPADGASVTFSDEPKLREWLAMFADRPNTFEAYRKESERFWLWLRARGQCLADVTHGGMLEYWAFLSAPPAEWLADAPYPRDDPRWRPFRRALSPASARGAMTILNGMFVWLVDAGHLQANPLGLMRRARQGKRRVTRFLTREQWRAVLEAVEAYPRVGEAAEARYARDRWMVRLLYMTALRASEAIGHTMGNFRRRDTTKGARWSLLVIGKGSKEREIGATAELMDELKLYRRSMGLTATPRPGDTTPLIGALRGDTRPLTRSGMYRALKVVFRAAAARLDEVEAENLLRASAHWLRHTRATYLVGEHVSLNSVRDLLGHASLTTTSIYAHEELDRAQDEIEQADRAIRTNAESYDPPNVQLTHTAGIPPARRTPCKPNTRNTSRR